MLQEYHRRRKDEKEDESDTDEEEHAAVMAATARLDGGQGCSGVGAEEEDSMRDVFRRAQTAEEDVVEQLRSSRDKGGL